MNDNHCITSYVCIKELYPVFLKCVHLNLFFIKYTTFEEVVNILKKVMQHLNASIDEQLAQMLRTIYLQYGIRFLTTTRLDVFDDGHPFDSSGEILDTGEIYNTASFDSFLDFLEHSYTGEWEPSYVSGHGKFHTTNLEIVRGELEQWMYTLLEPIVVHLCHDTNQTPEDFFEMAETDELYDFIWMKSYEICDTFKQIVMKDVIAIAHHAMNRQQRDTYMRLKEANKLLQFVKGLHLAKIMTVTVADQSLKFFLDEGHDMIGNIRYTHETHQKTFLNAIMQPNAIIIIRNKRINREIVYGFQNIHARIRTIPKDTLRHAYSDGCSCEIFAEYNL